MYSTSNPPYPKLGSEVAKWRLLAKSRELTADEKRRYGAAVGNAVRELQYRELVSGLAPERRCPCASGTWAADSKSIAEAVNRQNRAKLHIRAGIDAPRKALGKSGAAWVDRT